MKEKKEVDMLHGKLLGKMLLFAIPLAASSVLQQLFNSVDVAVVGRFASSQAQAAVGCNGSVINLLLNLFVGISVGANVVIAGYIGEGKEDKIKNAIHTTMLLALLFGVVVLFLGLFISRPILEWMDTPADVLEQAVLYLRIYFLGMPCIMLYNFGAAVLRSVGDTKRPLYCLIISGVLNAVLNYILVKYVHLGVAGVAIATDVSNLVSAVMILAFLMREKGVFRLELGSLRLSRVELNRILKIGIPAAIQSSVFSVANVFIQTALNTYGSNAVAGSAVTLNFEFYTYFVITAFAQTAVTFISQNYGAGQFKRCREIFRTAMVVCMAVVVCMSLLFVLKRGFFIGLFTKDPEVAYYAEIRMIYLLTPYVIIPTYEIGGAALRGIGHSMTPAVLTVFGTCVLRLTWIYTVCRWFRDYRVLMMIYPISWVVTGTLVLGTYLFTSRKVEQHIA